MSFIQTQRALLAIVSHVPLRHRAHARRVIVSRQQLLGHFFHAIRVAGMKFRAQKSAQAIRPRINISDLLQISDRSLAVAGFHGN